MIKAALKSILFVLMAGFVLAILAYCILVLIYTIY